MSSTLSGTVCTSIAGRKYERSNAKPSHGNCKSSSQRATRTPNSGELRPPRFCFCSSPNTVNVSLLLVVTAGPRYASRTHSAEATAGARTTSASTTDTGTARRRMDALYHMSEAQTISPARRWAVTLSVMMVTVMQVLDTSVTNVALPHMQGSMSAGIEEMSWVVTSYLAANAVVIPATGWLSARFGRRRFFLICTVLFSASSFLSGIAPNLEFLVAMRVLQGLGGGPVIPMAQAIMWEIFPLRMRGTAMAVWGVGIMLAPILGPTVGGWLADNWSWRWIFYINMPIGFVGFVMVSAFLFDSPFVRKPRGIDAWGLVAMVIGFACLQLGLDLGEREDWLHSDMIAGLFALAVIALV